MSKLHDKDIHVLYIPSWLPTAGNQFAGSFILDQARAVQTHTPVHVGFIYREDLSIRRKNDVLISCLDGFDHEVIAKPYIPKLNSLSISTWASQYFDAFQKYTKRFGMPDIVHAHSYVAGFAASHILSERGLPFVLTEHLTSFIDQNIRKAHLSSLKKVLSNAECVIVVSNILQEAIASYTDRSIQVIPNLFDEQIFKPSATPQNEYFTIVSIGDLIPRKRFDLLLKAFKVALELDSGLRLVIIGIGPLKEKLEAQAHDLNLASSVSFRGACTPGEVAREIQMSDLCISTSSTETFGITLIEAMACGKPVVATPSGGPRDIITPETGILTADGTAKTIATAILDMKRNKEKYHPEEIAEYATKKFASKMIAGQILDIYRNVLNK